MRRIYSWDKFKVYLDRGLSSQEVEDHTNSARTWVYVFDGPLQLGIRLVNPSTEWTDYVDNYQSNANRTFTDSNNIPLSRGKVTQTGWFYQEHALEINTATTGGYYNADRDGTDLGFTTYTLLDSAGDVTTTELDATETVVTWEPTHDIEIIGSQFYQAVAPTSDVRMYVTAVPDYPAPIGSVPFVEGGANLRYMGVGNILTVDGRSAKQLKYANPVPGTNKFEIRFRHDAGVQHDIQVIVEMFRP